MSSGTQDDCWISSGGTQIRSIASFLEKGSRCGATLLGNRYTEQSTNRVQTFKKDSTTISDRLNKDFKCKMGATYFNFVESQIGKGNDAQVVDSSSSTLIMRR